MADRISGAQRISLANVAEREILRYKDDHALWHKHVHNVDLDPMQVLKCVEMDKHHNTIDFSCRRTGKTAIKELYLLKFQALNHNQELGIVAPREAQAIVNLNYHLDAIRRSPILSAYIGRRAGRATMADTYYQFQNKSIARAYGIMAQVDGGDLTVASLEEVDDMPRERLFSRFLLMMGSSRRLGAAKNAKNDPQVRITGVFKGADTLTDLLKSKSYMALPVVDLYLGLELGILQPEFMSQMRNDLDPAEYIRQLLCKNISSQNVIWQSKVRSAMQLGLDANIQLAQPLPGMRYKKRGLISFGYDAGGHGEKPESSKHALVVTEAIGNYLAFSYVMQWPAGADDVRVKNDLISMWRYFQPDYALGDAYAVGMLTQLNDDLFRLGLTHIDRRAIGDGDSTASTWPEWPFAPIRFEGMTKHQMAMALRSVFHNDHAVIPYFEDFDFTDTRTEDLRALTRQLPNIKSEPTKAAYASYKMADEKLGDDCFDAAMASVWGHATRGAGAVMPVVLTSSQNRSNYLPQPVAA